jgi:3-deoxy-D-manno-octulosonic-acid transferase
MMARYMRFVHRTSTVTIEPEDASERIRSAHPFILTMWHGQFLMMPLVPWGGFPVAAIVARHGDAEVLSQILPRFGVELVRGAGAGTRTRVKDRGGAHALRSAVRLLKDGSTFCMTADIPPGPARRAGIGIVTMARMSGRPIVPFAVASSRYIAFNTWSRMTLNLPFSKLAYSIGDPIWVPRDANETELEEYRVAVEEAMNQTTKRAYAAAGADPTRATPPSGMDPSAPPDRPGWQFMAYRAVTNILKPAAPLLLKFRERQGKEQEPRMPERYGKTDAVRPKGLLVWLHAASVGETISVLPLIERVTHLRPDAKFLLTTGTVTSAKLAGERLGPNALHQYVPLDIPEYAARFLDHWRPDAALFTESEIWPNLIVETNARGIPIMLVNGRISARSFTRWRRHSGISSPLFSRFSVILAQNERLSRSFNALGARRVITAGNLKADAPPPPVDLRKLDKLRVSLGPRPVFIAASTHDGEEQIVAQAHRIVARTTRNICTIIAPRHPERGKAIATMLRQQGLTVTLRSEGELPSADTEIYIADTIGELGTLYALAPVAFVGGSLVEHGGQNPIEPIRQGAAVLTGPHWGNFRDFYTALLRHKGAAEVKSAEELAAAVVALLDSHSDLEQMRKGADTALSSLSGALERTANAVLTLLPPPADGDVRRAS